MNMQVYKGTAPRRPSDVLKYELFPDYCRDTFILLAGSGAARSIVIGALLAMTLTAASAEVTDGDNAGDGTLTMDATTPVGANAQAGDYVVTCFGGTLAAEAAADGGNAANTGALTLATPALGAGAKVGDYRVVCIEPDTDAGTFRIEDPDGIEVGIATAGVAFDGVVKFTIADGSTDFSAGEGFTITVSQSVGSNVGSFTVVAPDGTELPNAVAGTPYTGTHIQFAIADGDADFEIGDTFTVTVTLGSSTGKAVAWDPDASDGTEILWGIGLKSMTADDGVDAFGGLALRRGPAIAYTGEIQWPDGITDAQKAAAIATLAGWNILVR